MVLLCLSATCNLLTCSFEIMLYYSKKKKQKKKSWYVPHKEQPLQHWLGKRFLLHRWNGFHWKETEVWWLTSTKCVICIPKNKATNQTKPRERNGRKNASQTKFCRAVFYWFLVLLCQCIYPWAFVDIHHFHDIIKKPLLPFFVWKWVLISKHGFR